MKTAKELIKKGFLVKNEKVEKIDFKNIDFIIPEYKYVNGFKIKNLLTK